MNSRLLQNLLLPREALIPCRFECLRFEIDKLTLSHAPTVFKLQKRQGGKSPDKNYDVIRTMVPTAEGESGSQWILTKGGRGEAGPVDAQEYEKE